MVRLPVSGLEVAVRPLGGADALLLQERAGSPVSVGLALLDRIASPQSGHDGEPWSALSITDFEILMAAVRMQALGPVMTCGLLCPEPACGEQVELALDLLAYLAPIRPRRPHDVAPAPGRPGWFRRGQAVFRLPSAGDQAEALEGGGARLLEQRCLEVETLPQAERGRAERAMAMMAPPVSRPVGGLCPSCGAAVQAGVHLTALVIAELRRAAAYVIDEVHLIAGAYGWGEAEILALPESRRQAYAQRIRRQAA